MHTKNEVIKTKEGYFKCICVDNETAVFAKSNKAGTRTKYRDMFAVSNFKGSGFEYEIIN